MPNVQWRIPDDGQRNCPKHVEFLDKISLRNSTSVGFTKKKFVTTHGHMNAKISAYIYRHCSVVYSTPLPVTQNTQRGILHSAFFLFVFVAIHNNSVLVAARSTCIFHPRSVFALFLRFVYCEFVNTICCCELFLKTCCRSTVGAL